MTPSSAEPLPRRRTSWGCAGSWRCTGRTAWTRSPSARGPGSWRSTRAGRRRDYFLAPEEFGIARAPWSSCAAARPRRTPHGHGDPPGGRARGNPRGGAAQRGRVAVHLRSGAQHRRGVPHGARRRWIRGGPRQSSSRSARGAGGPRRPHERAGEDRRAAARAHRAAGPRAGGSRFPTAHASRWCPSARRPFSSAR